MNFFKLKENNTSIKQELNAGLTTFLTMVYIVPVNAIIMSKAGMPVDVVLTATALLTMIATIVNGLWANTPIAMSVGMGLNAYFAFGIVLAGKASWQTSLGIVFISAFIFFILSFTNFRIWILKSIPMDLRRAISAGIGAFIAFIGLKQMGFISSNSETLVALGNFSDKNVILGVIGLFFVIASWAFKIKGGFILAVIATSIVAWIFGFNEAPNTIFSMPSSVSPIFLELDIIGALKLSLVPVIITFFITHLFDSLGTLSGVGNRAGIFDNKDGLVKLEKTLQADSGMAVVGSCFGLSTITAFAESASGVEAGGRTGLCAVFTGLFFILTLFMLPFFKSIPANAIYPVLVMVGILMFSELGRINFKDQATSVTSFLIVMLMPLTYSITNGLACGFLVYLFIKLIKKEFEDINLGIITLSLISLIAFLVY
ncbi:xanthine/uracil permease family protein [Campylobacter sputorum subsp. bubulus]|uniref:Xanthine/uracil permease family protein n=1 Tax=Campylobacter sputorum subsp. sputorum TaxID=32024 RepID=A0A381DLQ8_9BACT|nr:NCS2 family permease [Campylobacter sputorum]ASM34837.1 xanthine/uracil/vitamin C permease [Campylobacter sputorum aubsp. sputorum RM3237]ASM36502.1 xanthine/uracil/vitamin C permease [Campylobacter sputorum bv. faecalis CCUG 20703]KAB0580027.1 NCS2 family permease [Campylobacter sputorum subsp. sputorum]QEL05030.1 xanthine/uracil/vitamin C permease [Campylobacter sputorum subsp. sputorum]SUX10222.1 xanthine/uracil permease family protein [Campylobacter sputorum subsp. bubulus]